MNAYPDYEHAKFNKSRKYTLDNGATVYVEYSTYYGDMVTGIQFADGREWHCSNGIADLPTFAESWKMTIHGHCIVKPKFTAVWDKEGTK